MLTFSGGTNGQRPFSKNKNDGKMFFYTLKDFAINL